MKHLSNFLKIILIFTVVLSLSSCSDKYVPKKSNEKKIISFSFPLTPKVDAAIDSVTGEITATLPVGTDITKLAPTIEVSPLASVSPKSGTVQDFSEPISYTVGAENWTSRVYKVSVTSPKSSEKQLLSFKFSELTPVVTGIITEGTSTSVAATVPKGTSLKALKPSITVSPGATISPASGVAQDFTQEVKYTITADDGSKLEIYVRVVIDINTKITAVSSVIWKSGDVVELTGYNFDDSRPIQRNYINLRKSNGEYTTLSVWATNPNLIVIPITPNIPAGEYIGISSDVLSANTTSDYFFEKIITMLPIAINPKITSVNKTKLKVGESFIVQGENLSYPDAYTWIHFFELPSLQEEFWPRAQINENGSISVPFPNGKVGKKYKIKATIGNVITPLFDQEIEVTK